MAIGVTPSMRKLPFFEASATLIGTVIGAGILGIPFVVAKVGFAVGLILMVILGSVVLLKNLILAEISLRTPHIHQLPGYVGIYLGKIGKTLSLVVLVIGGYGSLLAYTLGEGQILQALLGGSSAGWAYLFLGVASVFVYCGLNIIKRSELIMTGFIFLITLLIGLFAWNEITFSNMLTWQPLNWVLPYGVLLFAFSGAVAIPEMREQLRGREKLLPKAIVLASVLVFTVYVVFTFLVLGVTGLGSTEVATIGLGARIGPKMIVIGNLLAFFTMSTSFLTLALGMREMFQFDYHLKKLPAFLITVTVPLVFLVLGTQGFIKIIGLVGGVLIGLQSTLLILTFWRARKQGWRTPEFSLGPMKFTGALIIIMFLVGMVATLVNL